MQRSGGGGHAERGGQRRVLLANAGLALGSVLLCLLAAEIAARLLVDLSRYRPVEVHDMDPGDGISFLPGSQRRYETSELRFSIAANRFGRRDIEWSEASLRDPSNVLVIGDSFVLGYGLDDASTVSTLLEAHAAAAGRPREFFNFGSPGAGPLEYALLLDKALAIGIAARTVLLGVFVGNDFDPYVLSLRPPRPAPEQEPPPPPSYLVDFLRRRVSQSARSVGWILTLGRWTGMRLYDTTGSYIFLREQTDEQRNLFRSVLELIGKIRASCEAHDRRLLIAIFPSKIQVENGPELDGAIFDSERPSRAILDYCAEIHVPCFDLLAPLRAGYERVGHPLYFPIDRHLNATGSEIAADAIFADLEREGALR